MRYPLKFSDKDFAQLIENLSIQEDEEFFGDDFFNNHLVQKIEDPNLTRWTLMMSSLNKKNQINIKNRP